MNILYTFNSGDPGGMEKHVFDLAVGMRNRGHNVGVWCCDGPVVKWFEAEDITVVTRGINFDIDPFYIKNLIGYLRLEKVEVIHAHELKAVIHALIAAALVGTEVRVTHTHTPITEWRIGFFKKVADIALDSFMVNRYSSSEIALTKSRKTLKLKEGIRESKLRVIPNALDTKGFDVSAKVRTAYRRDIRSRYNIPEDAYIFGNVSRMTREKNQQVLVKAFEQFVSADPTRRDRCYLLLAGGGLLERDIRDRAQLSGVADKIVITGVFPYEDLVKLYASFDAFVFPTLAEGFGYVLVEAMYMQLPVLCSDLTVLQEVGGDAVSFFKTTDVADLVKLMSQVFAERADFKKLGVKAKKHVKAHYSLDTFITAYEDLYKELFEKFKKGAS